MDYLYPEALEDDRIGGGHPEGLFEPWSNLYYRFALAMETRDRGDRELAKNSTFRRLIPAGKVYAGSKIACARSIMALSGSITNSPQMVKRYAADYCNQLLQALIVLVCSLIRKSEAESGTDDHDLGERVKRYIDDHYTEDVRLESIADALHISHYCLAHRFKDIVGCSPIQYLIRRRIGEAQSLLINTDLSATEIATLVGYDNSNYFNTSFKKIVGVTPNGYRKQCTT